MMKRLFLLIAFFSACFNLYAGISSAELYRQFQSADDRYRPFVRWWWNGNKVDSAELARELHLLHDAGIGGVEINPVAFPGEEEQAVGHESLTWLSDAWCDRVHMTLDTADALGMQCDLIIGSGWPFGAETLTRNERASVLLTYAMELEGGLPVEISRFHLLSSLDPGVSVPNPGRMPQLLSLKLTPDSIVSVADIQDITDSLQGDMMTLHLPEGRYVLYALVRYDSFASVINGAKGASGSMLNHLDAAAVRAYLRHMTATIAQHIQQLPLRLRALFVDSMELEGMNYTSDLIDEFIRRRGYDPTALLPFTMFKVGRLGNVERFDYGAKKSPAFQEQVNRVRFDFELTKAELLEERYTRTLLDWAHSEGFKVRAQAYGNGFFQLEPSLGYDIPEGESWTTNYLRHKVGYEMGDDDYRRGRSYTMINKYVSSAAHLSGKRLVSSEEMTNTYMVFNTPLELLKVGSDMNAVVGITHSVWHGFNYSPQDAPYPGWIIYGSYYNEHNPWWPYWRLLNDYRTRMSSLLQNADMVTDIAILPPNYDLWTEYGVQTEPFPVKLNVEYTSLLWEAIHKNGGGADYISETILRDATVRDGYLCYGPKRYHDLFLPDVSSMTEEGVERLTEFTHGGGRVFCVGSYPCKSLGYQDYLHRDSVIADRIAELRADSSHFILLDKPEDGRYLEWYGAVMERYGLPHALTITHPDRFVLQSHYVTDSDDDVYLLVNAHREESRSTDLIFPPSVYRGKTAWLYDCTDGRRYRLPVDKEGRLSVRLDPAETWLIVFNRATKGDIYRPFPDTCSGDTLRGPWQAHFAHGHAQWSRDTVMDTLTDLKQTAFDRFMGTVTYTATFEIQGDSLPRYIDLGRVCEIAELSINGQSVGVRWYGRKVFDIAPFVKPGTNDVAIKVTTMMGNYLQTMPDNPATKRFLTRRKAPIVSAGLIGPVRLIYDSPR